MIRKLLTTTAISVLMATGAIAAGDDAAAPKQDRVQETQATQDTQATQETQAAMPADALASPEPGDMLASELTGKWVYSGSGDDAERIGEVNDIILSPEGEAKAIIVGVGGFLGIGEKEVALSFDALQMDARDGETRIVAEVSREELEAAPTFDVAILEQETGEEAPSEDVASSQAEQPADDQQMAAEQPAEEAAGEQEMAAEDTEAASDAFASPEPGDMLASNLIGKWVYSGSGDDAERIGEVNDIILSQEGEAEAIIVGVGGFLGVGEKEVALSFDALQMDARDRETRIIAEVSREELEAAPAFDVAVLEVETTEQPAGEQRTAAEQPTEEPAGEQEMAAEETQPLEEQETAAEEGEPADDQQMAAEQPTEPAEEQITTGALPDMQPVEAGTVSADDLIGANVFGANNEDIGEIGDVLLTEDDQVAAYVVDVGGFLGIGEKPVAIDAENLQILSDGQGNYSVKTEFTQAQLETQQRYEPEAYRADPESSVLRQEQQQEQQ